MGITAAVRNITFSEACALFALIGIASCVLPYA